MRLIPLFNAILRSILNANGNRIVNVGEPTEDNDAATKKYVHEHAGEPADYSTVRTNAAAGAAHAADPNPHVTAAEKQKWNAKQDALTPTQLANIDDVPNKRDRSDMFTEWVTTYPYPGLADRPVRVGSDTDYQFEWKTADGRHTFKTDAYRGDEPLSADFTCNDAEITDTFQATRQRILTTDDVTDELESPTEGKAADAAAVKTSLEGKLDKSGGVVNGNLTLNQHLLLKSPSKFILNVIVPDLDGDQIVRMPIISGDIALTSDIADATKLTPVYGGWTIGDHAAGLIFRNISATYDEDVKGWKTEEEYSSDGGETWISAFVPAEGNPDPDGTATRVVCVSAFFIRSVVGYKLGEKTAETDPTLNGMTVDDINTLVKDATKDKRDKTDLDVSASIRAWDFGPWLEKMPSFPATRAVFFALEGGGVWYKLCAIDGDVSQMVGMHNATFQTKEEAEAYESFTPTNTQFVYSALEGVTISIRSFETTDRLVLASEVPTDDRITKVAEAACKYKLNDADTNGVKDRAINTTTASEIEIPADFTDLILRTSGAVTKLTMTGIASAYGDDLPTEGNNLITVTRIAAGAVFIKVVAMEDNSYAGA